MGSRGNLDDQMADLFDDGEEPVPTVVTRDEPTSTGDTDEPELEAELDASSERPAPVDAADMKATTLNAWKTFKEGPRFQPQYLHYCLGWMSSIQLMKAIDSWHSLGKLAKEIPSLGITAEGTPQEIASGISPSI